MRSAAPYEGVLVGRKRCGESADVGIATESILVPDDESVEWPSLVEALGEDDTKGFPESVAGRVEGERVLGSCGRRTAVRRTLHTTRSSVLFPCNTPPPSFCSTTRVFRSLTLHNAENQKG